MKYHLDALEFNQVLDILANYAKTDYAKELISKSLDLAASLEI